jgi:LysR family hydrogen peroxide-inducible transcriptional activator
MELRQLLYALTVAQEKSFSKAARVLHLAQPSLSQQIRKLEEELGVPLFHRIPGDLTLTEAGERFIRKAEYVLDLVEQMRREMDDVAGLHRGRLVVGCLPMTGSHVLPLVLPAFRERFPEVEVVLVEETTWQLETLTKKGRTDFSILTLPLSGSELAWEEIAEEPIMVAVPRCHPLAEQCAVSLPELAGEPFIFLKEGQGFRQIALDLCRTAGFAPRIVFETTNIETAQSLVAAGMGVAFVPQMVARNRSDPYAPRYLSLLENPPPTRKLVCAYRRGRYLSFAARSFIQMMQWGAKTVADFRKTIE